MIQRYARPYAQALLGTVVGVEAATRAREGLATFCAALEAVPDLGRMAANPAIPMEVKERVVAEVADALGLEPVVASFLHLLLTHYRLVHAAAVLEAVDEILGRRLGRVTAAITTAEPLGEEQRASLTGALANLLDQEVEVETTVDPELLAGFVVLVGSRRYDASLRGQLQRLAAELVTSSESTASGGG